MKYEVELQFFVNILRNLDLPVRIFTISDEKAIHREEDIYSMLYPELSYTDIFGDIFGRCRSSCIYRIYDEFFCTYVLFRLPETEEPLYLLIGPYTKFNIEKEEILANANRLSIPPSMYPQMEKFYMNLASVSDSHSLSVLINTFGTLIWGGADAFVWENVDTLKNNIFSIPIREGFVSEFEDPYAEQRKLEHSYQAENRFMEAISLGQMEKAEQFMKKYTVQHLEKRLSDSVRDVKNYSIILNTILRKAAERGGVHPMHLHKISSGYAKEIELLTSAEAAVKLHKRMVHKYCLLVKNHSLKSYSPLIKKVVTNIDADLTADLTLKSQAELLNVNASYLSSLFKKEMGVTLTEYVNKSRISQAVNFLNTTNMQIQSIAQYCGIPDVNYFTKLFKKYIGKTPQEYRRNILNSSKKR